MEIGYKEKMDAPYGDLPVRVLPMDIPPGQLCFAPHWHERIEFLQVDEGGMLLTCRGRTAPVEAGETAVVCPGELHGGRAGPFGVRYTVVMGEPELMDEGDACAARFIRPVFSGRLRFRSVVRDDVVRRCLTEIAREDAARLPAYPMQVKGLFFELFARLYREHVAPEAASRLGGASARPEERMEGILQYVDGHFTEPLSTAETARRFAFTEPYFCRYFRQRTGMTFVEYLTHLRLERGGSLLRSTDKPVAVVAEECGFADANYFTRRFTRRFGMPPQAWREKTP